MTPYTFTETFIQNPYSSHFSFSRTVSLPSPLPKVTAREISILPLGFWAMHDSLASQYLKSSESDGFNKKKPMLALNNGHIKVIITVINKNNEEYNLLHFCYMAGILLGTLPTLFHSVQSISPYDRNYYLHFI